MEPQYLWTAHRGSRAEDSSATFFLSTVSTRPRVPLHFWVCKLPYASGALVLLNLISLLHSQIPCHFPTVPLSLDLVERHGCCHSYLVSIVESHTGRALTLERLRQLSVLKRMMMAKGSSLSKQPGPRRWSQAHLKMSINLDLTVLNLMFAQHPSYYLDN